ncbi:sugar transferase [Anaerolineales bacterium HSG6]|nr:sugar transferase [Anaerolineales bacterium HSG6]MDM8530050.1 sugar transferase [Anaerolineales bacterium HSG25]
MNTTQSADRTVPESYIVDTSRSERYVLILGLILVDLAMLAIAFRLAFYLRFENSLLSIIWDNFPASIPHTFYQTLIFWLVPLWIIIFGSFGLYSKKNLFSGTIEYASVFNACTLGMLLIVLMTFFDPELVIARGWLLISWMLTLSWVGIGRFTVRRIVKAMRMNGFFAVNVLIVGANEEGKAIAKQLSTNPRTGINIVGFVDDNEKSGVEVLPDLFVLGSIETAHVLVDQGGIHELIVPTTAVPREKLLRLIKTFVGYEYLTIRLSSGLYEILTTGVQVQKVNGVPLISIDKVRLTGSDLLLKRALDVGVSFAVLPVLLLIALPIAIAIRIESPGPIMYRRRVIGVGGREFDAFKFRTMFIDGNERLAKRPDLLLELQENFKLKEDPRVTSVGGFLRPKSLDELPQIINVLRGQMSLIGPRMITAEEQEKYGKWRTNLVTVKPGITGLWQVSGRSDLSYEDRVMLDMHYIRNYTIWMDVHVLLRTIPAVLAKRGAY